MNLCTLILSIALGQDTVDEPAYSGPYCGIYCVFAAAKSFGLDADFSRLIAREYLSSDYGSTIDDLKRAFESFGLYGHPFAGETNESIAKLDCPAILHVTSPGRSGYRHWVLFLGFTDNGLASIYDPPRSKAVISPAELLSIWDGSGVAVTTDEQSPFAFRPPLSSLAATVLLLCALIAASRLFPGRSSLAILITPLIAAGLWHSVLPNGLAANSAAVGNVRSAHFTPEVKEIEYSDLIRYQSQADTVLVDARVASDFRSGHLPGATSVPITIGYVALRDKLSGIPPDRRVICYCQSENCGWGRIVANHFANRGYREVLLYRGGYREWQSRQKTD